MTEFGFQACCAAAGADATTGYIVPVDAPHSGAGPIVDTAARPTPEVPFETALHEASHAAHLHCRGYRIASARIGLRNCVERAPGEGRRMTDLEQIEAALAGDIGALYAGHSAIWRPPNEDIDAALARVATGCHGKCDHCIAGTFARHIATRGDPADAALARDTWRLAEADTIALIQQPRVAAAIRKLAERLLVSRSLAGDEVHHILSNYIEFGAFAGKEN